MRSFIMYAAGPPVIADASGCYVAGFAATQHDVPAAQRTPTPSMYLKAKQESFYSQDAQPPHRCASSRTLLESQAKRVGMLTSPKPSIAPASVRFDNHSDAEERSHSPTPTRAGFEVPPPAPKQARDGLWWKHFSSIIITPSYKPSTLSPNPLATCPTLPFRIPGAIATSSPRLTELSSAARML